MGSFVISTHTVKWYGYFGHIQSPTHAHNARNEAASLQRAFAFRPEEDSARELGVSVGSIRDWTIYAQYGSFDWVVRRPELLQSAVDYWFEHYPIGYSDVAKQFGVRPATLFQKTCRTVARFPEQVRLKRILF